MKILVLDAVATPDSGGVYTVLQDFYRDACLKKNIDFIFIVGSDNLLEPQDNVKIIVNQKIRQNYFYRVCFDFVFGSRYVRQFHADIVLSFQNTGIIALNIPQLVYVHQPIAFQRTIHFSPFKSSERKMFFYQYVVGSVVKTNLFLLRHAEIVVQTKWMQDAIGRISNNPIRILKPKIDAINNELILTSAQHLKSKYLFYPSTAMIYKNHSLIVNAYAQMSSNFKVAFPLKLTITKKEYVNMYGNPLDDTGIEFLGRIQRKKVLDILAQSTLIFPSKLETLGLPLLEAATLGRPIIALKTSPNVETVGSYQNVRWFDGDSVGAVAKLLKESEDFKFFKKDPIVSDQANASGWSNLIKELESFSKK